MMPRVTIRNVSKEYKLVASVFSPELFKLEENWGKAEPIQNTHTSYENDNYASSTLNPQTKKPLSKSSLSGNHERLVV